MPKMISIREAVDSGAWFKATCSASDDFRFDGGAGILEFRFRLREFVKIDLSSYSNEQSTLITKESNIWKVRLDIVNMHKQELRSDLFGDILDLKDPEGFVFGRVKDSGFLLEQPAHPDLKSFFCSELPPKIKKTGAFAYELPEFFDDMFVFVCFHQGIMAEA